MLLVYSEQLYTPNPILYVYWRQPLCIVCNVRTQVQYYYGKYKHGYH